MVTEAAPRAKASARRRGAILDAALACFTRKGYAATTMADVRRASGASIGSIYHHFPSKEELAAALYVEGLRGYQEEVAVLLAEHPGAEDGVKAVVQHHLEWVSRNEDLARYLLGSRPAEVALATRAPLRALNRTFFRAIRDWLDPHVEAGRIRALPSDVHHAILLGPSQELARLSLAGRTSTGIERAAGDLAEAAWNALRGD